MGGRELLWKACEEKLAALRKEQRKTAIGLEVVEAAVVVYRRHGERHPSTYGVGNSVEDLAARLHALRDEIAGWEDALALVDGLDAPAVRPVVQPW